MTAEAAAASVGSLQNASVCVQIFLLFFLRVFYSMYGVRCD